LLTHELSRAIVANGLGRTVRRISLFIFGRMAHMNTEPRATSRGTTTSLVLHRKAILGLVASVAMLIHGNTPTLLDALAISAANWPRLRITLGSF